VLRHHGLGVPAQKSRDEFSRFVAEYAKSIDAPTSPLTMGSAMDGVVDRVAADPATVTLVPANFNVPEGHGFRVLPIRPVPLFPWYAVWRSDSPQALVPQLLRSIRQLSASHWNSNEHGVPTGAPSLDAGRPTEEPPETPLAR